MYLEDSGSCLSAVIAETSECFMQWAPLIHTRDERTMVLEQQTVII